MCFSGMRGSGRRKSRSMSASQIPSIRPYLTSAPSIDSRWSCKPRKTSKCAQPPRLCSARLIPSVLHISQSHAPCTCEKQERQHKPCKNLSIHVCLANILVYYILAADAPNNIAKADCRPTKSQTVVLLHCSPQYVISRQQYRGRLRGR